MLPADLTLADKLAHLQKSLKEMESILIAYSGGVDSSLLLKAASITRCRSWR